MALNCNPNNQRRDQYAKALEATGGRDYRFYEASQQRREERAGQDKLIGHANDLLADMTRERDLAAAECTAIENDYRYLEGRYRDLEAEYHLLEKISEKRGAVCDARTDELAKLRVAYSILLAAMDRFCVGRRPDGTYNLERDAVREIAKDARNEAERYLAGDEA